MATVALDGLSTALDLATDQRTAVDDLIIMNFIALTYHCQNFVTAGERSKIKEILFGCHIKT